jgi:hypothetical protein
MVQPPGKGAALTIAIGKDVNIRGLQDGLTEPGGGKCAPLPRARKTRNRSIGLAACALGLLEGIPETLKIALVSGAE